MPKNYDDSFVFDSGKQEANYDDSFVFGDPEAAVPTTKNKAPVSSGIIKSEMRAYEPTIWDKVKDFFPANKARASNELAARNIAKDEGVDIGQVYQDVGGSRPMLNPEGRAPIRALSEGAAVVAKDLPNIPAGFKNTILRTIRGGDTSVDDKNWIDRAIKESDIRPDPNADPNYITFQNMGQNLAYSFTTMGSALITGAAVTAATGGNVMAGGAAAMATSGAVAFRGSKDQFLDRVKENTNNYYKELYGRKMTQKEWEAAYTEWNSAANKYGAWEAIPEAVGNLIAIKIFSAPLKGAGLSKLRKITSKAKNIAGKMTQDYPAEVGTETVTQMGQNRAEIEAGLANRKIGVTEAFKQVAPATALTVAGFGGGSAAISSAKSLFGGKGKTKATQPPEPFRATHKVSGGIPAQQATKAGKPVPDIYVDAQGNVYRDPSAVEIQKPVQGQPFDSALDAGPLDANAQAEAIRAEVFGGETTPEANQGIINRIYGGTPVQPLTQAEINQRAINAAAPAQARPVPGTSPAEATYPGEIDYQAPDVTPVAAPETVPEVTQPETGIKAQGEAKGKAKPRKGMKGFKSTRVKRGADVAAAAGHEDLLGQVSKKDIDKAANEAATSPKNNLPEPTEAQKSQGNYKVGKIAINGLDISIENPKGSVRTGTDKDGETWSQKLNAHYGYIRGKGEGADGDAVDVFLTDSAGDSSLPVFVVDQVDPKTGTFDEHKIVMGAETQNAAEKTYLDNYEKGWKGLGGIKEFTLDEFKAWLDGDTTKPVTDIKVPDKKGMVPRSTKLKKSLEVETKKEPETKDRFQSFLDKTAKRILMEEQGQDILYDLEDSKTSPQTVSDRFWKEIYPDLNPRMQEKFNKYLKSLSGWEPGSVVAFNPDTGEKTTADTWPDLAKYYGEDFPASVEGLEGTERGYVALMAWAMGKKKPVIDIRGKSKLINPDSKEDGSLAKAIRKDVLDQYAKYTKETQKDIKEYASNGHKLSNPPSILDIPEPKLLSFEEWVNEGYPNNPNIQFNQYDSPFLNAEAVENIADSYVELRSPNDFLYDNLPDRYKHIDSANEDGWSASLIDDIGYVFSQSYLEEIAKDLGLESYFLTVEKSSEATGRKKPYEINIRTGKITEFKGEPDKGAYVVIPKIMIAEKFKSNPGKFLLKVKELIGIIDDSNKAAVEDFLGMAREFSKSNREKEYKKSPNGRRASFNVIQGGKGAVDELQRDQNSGKETTPKAPKLPEAAKAGAPDTSKTTKVSDIGKVTKSDEKQATEILNSAEVTGTDRLEIMSKFRAGEYSLDDLRAAYPEKLKVEPEEITITEEGKVFSTGTPVTFGYLKNLEQAPDMGSRFQQDIEPAGRYMVHKENADTPTDNWEKGEVTFNNPLVIEINTTPGEIYDENSWKARLSKKYKGKTGAALSKVIVKDGYDGIVTVDLNKDGIPRNTSEIVDLTSFIEKKKPAEKITDKKIIDDAVSEHKTKEKVVSYLNGRIGRDKTKGLANYIDSAIAAESKVKKADKEAEYSRTEKTKIITGISKQAARDSLVAQFGKNSIETLENNNTLIVLENESELPTKLNDGKGGIKGVYDPVTDKVYIIASNTTAKEMPGLLLHELGEHYGMEKMLGTELYKKVLKQAKGMVNLGHKGMAAARLRVPKDTAPENIESETLAYFLQDTANAKTSLFKRIIAAIKAFLFKRGFNVSLATEDLQALAVASIRASVRESRPVRDNSGKVVPQMSEQAAMFSSAGKNKTETPEFKAWFGDSKVVDENGEPLVVYHGTAIDFEAFISDEYEHAGSIWFAYDPELAEIYAVGEDIGEEDGGARILPVYLKAENIFDTSIPEHRKIFDDFAESGVLEWAGELELRFNSNGDLWPDWQVNLYLIPEIMKMGFDAVNVIDAGGEDSIGVFNPAQIKSAVGNTGAFDSIDSRILYSRGEEPTGARQYTQEQQEAIDKGGFGKRKGKTNGVAQYADTGIEVEEITDEEFERQTGTTRSELRGDDAARAIGGGQTRAGWREETKVVGNDGLPIRAFRGAKSKLTEKSFIGERLGGATGRPSAGLGVWFTTSRSEASEYASAEGITEDFFIDIRKPKIYKDGNIPEFNSVQEAQNHAQKLISKGYDGIVHDMRGIGGKVHFVAFNSDQVITAQSVKKLKTDIMYSRGDVPVENKLGMPEETHVEKWQRWFQNAFNRIQVLQKTVIEKGGTISPESDVYRAEELSSGKITAKLNDLDRNDMKPLIKQMKADGITLTELDEFMMARHAPERNRYIASINPDMPDGGSGITTAEAGDILKKYADKRQAFEAAAERVYAVNRKTLSTLVAGGHLKQETVDEWRSRWKYYVPLKGKEGEEGIHAGRGRGFSVRGSGILDAMGRGEGNIAESPTAHAFAQAESAIVRTEKTKVGQALISLIRENPDPDFWTISERTLKQFEDLYGESFEGYEKPPEGLVENIDYHRVKITTRAERELAKAEGRKPRTTVAYRLDPNYRNREDVISVMVGGKELLITVKDPLIAEQFMKMNSTQLNAVVASAGQVNRFLAMINTALNPEFVITNLERDFQTAMVNLSGEQSMAMAAKVAKLMPSAMKGIWQSVFDSKKRSEMREIFEEMQAEGGTIGFFGLEDIQTKVRKIQNKLENTQTILGRSKRGIIQVRDLILDANLSVENAARLAAYKVARDQWIANGMPAAEAKAKAASLSKNLTVNFNRKGELAPVLNSAYLFYNASIQGSARIFTALKHKRVRKIVTGIAVTSFALAMYNRAAGGDDEDGIPRWDKLSDYLKQTNIIIMHPDGSGEFTKIKLPYGYNVFWYAGVAITDLMFGSKDKTVAKVGMNMISTVLNAFNPIQGFDFLDTVTPTVLKPFEQDVRNVNFMGGPVRPESPFDRYERPDSEKYFKSTNPQLVEMMKYVNSATGGDETHPGLVDVSPETVKHYVGWLTGGAGMTATRATGTVVNLFSGEPVEQRNIPFIRTLGGKVGSRYDTEQFYNALKQVAAVQAQLKIYRGTEKYSDYRAENRDIQRLALQVSKYKSRIKKLREKRDRAYRDKNHDLAREYSEQIRLKMLEFTKKYNDATENQ